MPWKESNTMDLRVRQIQDHREGHSISALAEIYEVSRNTVYKWLERYAAEGAAGLANRSHAPLHSPSQLSPEVIADIVAARQRWKWGPRKLRVKLREAHPEILWPAESTIGEVLKRAGLTQRRKLRVRTPPYAAPFAAVDQANQTWCADFKGWFRTAAGSRCDPLTITDNFSRYLLRCQIVDRTRYEDVKKVFERVFTQFGLPRAIRSDNGPPFASAGMHALSRLNIWW